MAGIFIEFVKRLIRSEIESVVALSKVHAAIAALKILKGTRRLALIICLLIFLVVVFACGFLVVPIALCIFMPWSPETKTIVAVSFGAAYILIPIIAIAALLSEKRWIRASGIGRLMKDALKK